MGRHASTTPPDAYPTRPGGEQDRGGVSAPEYVPAAHDAPPGQGLPAGTAVPAPVPVPTTSSYLAPVGWPEQLADRPFSQEPTADLTAPGALSATSAAPSRREHPTEPTGTVDQLHEPLPPPEPLAHTPTPIEQAEEQHLDWLRHLPDRRDEAPAEHPPAHGRPDPEPPRETPRRERIERLVVGLIAGLVTFVATRWAGAGWVTAAWIGATVLVVVPTAAWVATLGSRSTGQPDRQPEH